MRKIARFDINQYSFSKLTSWHLGLQSPLANDAILSSIINKYKAEATYPAIANGINFKQCAQYLQQSANYWRALSTLTRFWMLFPQAYQKISLRFFQKLGPLPHRIWV